MKQSHFIGIKGVGVAPLAIIAKQAGLEVSGCDVSEEFITDKELLREGITPLVGFNPNHLQGVDLVITTGAHGGFTNPEVIAAKEKGISVWTQGQAVGEFMKGSLFDRQLKGISITGCHGKTTTTAMMATLLSDAGTDPSYVIGTGDIPSLSGSGHYGKGEYFIAEADEYATEPTQDKTPKFLWQYPDICIITNIEFDHPDLYHSQEEINQAYKKFTRNIREKGELIINGDDDNCRKITEQYSNNNITFGLNSNNNVVLSNIVTKDGKTTFSLVGSVKGKALNKEMFTLNVWGEHNAMNATAVVIAGLLTGLSIEQIQKGLLAFRGTKRRMEYIGQLASGAYLYDDYAHHPTEITKTLTAFRQQFPDKKIIVFFQPHTYSRTKILFDQFSSSFKPADVVGFVEIFPSARESLDPTISSQLLSEAVKETNKETLYLPAVSDVVKYINQNHFEEDTILITMGAGNIYKAASQLIFKHG